VCSARPLFARFDLLPVFSVYLLESCKFVRRYPHYFVKTRDVHSHETRSRSELYVIVQTLAISKKNPLYCLSILYNALPVAIRAEWMYSRYEKALKAFVYSKKFYNFREYIDFMSLH